MKLLVDIGNTRIKAVLCDPQQTNSAERLQVVDYQPQLLQDYPIDQITLAAVGQPGQVAILKQLAAQLNIPLLEVSTAKQQFGITCGYDNPATLGIDRWLAVLGAQSCYPNQHLVVVDAGTATTVDFLTADKRHLGGWIVPGLQLMSRSVTQNTQKVFDDQQTQFDWQVGDSTPQALKSGCFAAQIGVIQQGMAMMAEQVNRGFGEQPPAQGKAMPIGLVLTGGDAPVLLATLQQLGLSPIHLPLIVFTGLDRF